MKLSRIPLERITAWIRAHRTRSIIIASVLLVGGAGTTAYLLLSQPLPVITYKASAPKPKPIVKYYSPLTGDEVADEAATKLATTAIMIENSPDARPQSGLKDAGVVYEAIAEGGITRFLAIYQEDKPQLIGPVRSLRMYYVDWLAPFDASVAHVGGSAAALAEVRNGSYRDIDQFFNAGTYWRATDRYAPHNVYTSFEKLDALNVSKGFTSSTFNGFARDTGKASPTPNATSINVTISSPLYNPSYVYNPETNLYSRSLGGEPHNDREGGQIQPSTVIAMKVDEVTVMEDGYRQSITTSGSSEAFIFQNGTVTQGTWHKADRKSQLSFKDSAGAEVKLNRGQTWISAVPNGQGNVTWQ